MNCAYVQENLLALLEGEVGPSEQRLIERHLAACAACQRELATLERLRGLTRQALQAQADQAVPPAQAWSQLQARLAEQARLAPVGLAARLHRFFATGVQGGTPMKRAFVWSGLVTLVVVGLLVVFVLRSPAPVSAQAILDSAHAVRQTASEGIQHTRIEVARFYQRGLNENDLAAIPEAEQRVISEHYLDPQGRKFRSVMTQAESGQVLFVSAFDGTHTYLYEGQAPGEVVSVYRTALGAREVADSIPVTFNETERLFEEARSDPGVTLLGEETLPDGRRAHVLRTESRAVPQSGADSPRSFSLLYFAVDTYQLLETRNYRIVDGQETLMETDRVLVDEILPADTPVAWDLSDLDGIAIVDDPDAAVMGLLPEVISLDELRARGAAVYLLEPVPAGLELKIEATRPVTDEPVTYILTYHAESEMRLVLSGPSNAPDRVIEQAADTFETASGLSAHLLSEPDDQFISAILVTPDGARFDLSSTLPLDQVKALLETLVLAS